MQKTIPIFLFFFIPFLLKAQEFAKPDSAAVRKNHVREAQVYYSRGTVKNYLQHTYRYDREGRCIYEREGIVDFHYEYFFRPGERLAAHSVQRGENGKWIQAWDNEYFPGGELKHTKHYYSETDTLFPTSEFSYDKNGNQLEKTYYQNRKMTRYVQCRFNEKKECTWTIDSIVGIQVTEHTNGKMTRITYLDSQHIAGETWLLAYDSLECISGNTYRLPGKEDIVYTVSYKQGQAPLLLINGKKPSKEENDKWMFRWAKYLAKTSNGESGLPYSDPAPRDTWRHYLTRDKKGNIIEDKQVQNVRIQTEEPVIFTYQYIYYK